MELLLEIKDKVKLLDKALISFGNRGRIYAEAERDYRVALAQKMLEERTKYEPTPVTILSDICRGDKDIAMLKFTRDCKETEYKAAQEAIQTYKLQIRILEAQIEREWHSK